MIKHTLLLLITCSIFFLKKDNEDIIFYGNRYKNHIAITFDACPSSVKGGFDNKIVTTLIDSSVPATFFLSGRWIQKHIKETKFLASVANFEIGNHSYSHPHCNKIKTDSIKQELLLTEKLIKDITGKTTKLFRPPFGELNDSITQVANTLGYTIVMYDVESGDPDSTISSDTIKKYVCKKVRNGSIIIMHVNGRGWNTAKALPEVICTLRKQGFTFIKVSELINQLRNN